MKNILFSILLLYVNIGAIAQEIYRNPDVPLSNSISTFVLIHVVTSQEIKDSNIGEKIGTVAKYPKRLSEKFDYEIRKSKDYYDKRNFEGSKNILEQAIIEEPQNQFILDAYAKACYHVDRTISYLIYQNLINQLDSIYHNSDSLIVVDIWFRDAYWKLGTLHMDHQKWKEAYYEISRFLLSIQEAKGKIVYIQAIQYLTECAFMSYDDKLAQYLANRVLFYDPKNEYALDILEKIQG